MTSFMEFMHLAELVMVAGRESRVALPWLQQMQGLQPELQLLTWTTYSYCSITSTVSLYNPAM